jgi:hypothetical protein
MSAMLTEKLICLPLAKIKNFQTKEEISFYVDRLRAFMDFV